MTCTICGTLTASQCMEIQALYTLSTKKAVPPGSLCLVLPEPSAQEEDSFYGLCRLDGKLVSFLSVFCPDGKEAEISGFTHPEFQNRGYFSSLLSLAEKEISLRFGSPSLVYQCLTGDPGSGALCRSLGLSLCRSECLMEAQKPVSLHPAASVTLKTAGCKDRSLLFRLHKEAFGEDPQGFLDTLLADPASVSYLILKDGVPAGLFHLSAYGEDPIFYLCGFGILPSFRRRGLAKAALSELMTACLARGRLILQVSSSNGPAFRLYRSMGFQITDRQDYYRR